MTSRVARTLTIGSCAFALLALTDAAQAQSEFGGYPWLRLPMGYYNPIPQLPDCASINQTVTLALNTGTGEALGSADPIWTVGQGSTAYSTSSIWLADTPSTKWIQPAAGGTPVYFAGTETYVYQARFITPADPYFYDSITITGRFAADDQAVVWLNGREIARCVPPSREQPDVSVCFRTEQNITGVDWTYFSRARSGNQQTFLNTLTVEVKNTFAGSPSAFFAALTVTAVCSKCTAPAPGCLVGPPYC